MIKADQNQIAIKQLWIGSNVIGERMSGLSPQQHKLSNQYWWQLTNDIKI